MKIHLVGAELFRTDGQADKHDEANIRFSQFFGQPKNLIAAACFGP